MSILEILNDQLDDDAVAKIGSLLGTDTKATERAITGAIPVLIGALSRNAASADGLSSLAKAVTKDHDGSLLDNLGGFLGSGGNTGMGEAILGHILGSRSDRATTGLSHATGLNAGSVMKLLAILAPIVMAAVGRSQRQAQAQQQAGPQGQFNPADLSKVLRRDSQRIETADAGLGGLLGSLLDRDGDGPMDDIARLGTSVLGSLLGGGLR
jgi:hypothetical protein